MRYAWTEEQSLLRATLERLFAERFNFADRTRTTAQALSTEAWRSLAELGVLGLPFASEYGGSEGEAIDVVIVMEALGWGLVATPYLSTVVLGGGLLRHGADQDLKARTIPQIISGAAQIAFAFAEQESRFNPANVALSASQEGGHFKLNGRKAVVYGAPEAQHLFVSARTDGARMEREGVSLFIVPADAPGLEMRAYLTADRHSAADIAFHDVAVPSEAMIGPQGRALGLIERVLDEAVVAACAEAVGAIGALNARCVQHCRTREAFGQPLAKFQALRHRLVDMRVAYEQASAITLKAAQSLDGPSKQRSRMASACKTQVCQDSAFIAKAAVQLHGAIGMTDELDVGHYFRRVMLLQHLFGGADFHLRRFLDLSR
ncbi:MAG: acyl-CoA dehydrogenase [Hyphomonadaceae bacterium]|nr:acyl-CoA dehydrogenase [Hyphomonadaceae bacterium]